MKDVEPNEAASAREVYPAHFDENKTHKLVRDFRADINALRGIAVAIVVLFHFKVTGFWGGFVGVDVFFVISGFLMTRIIVTGLERGSFKFGNFYGARAKRIVPALLFLCMVLILVAAVISSPAQFAMLCRSVLSSITFLSNIDYSARGGYFAASPESNWLLHTWSLSVEWQFYMIYPVLFYIIAKWKFFERHKFLILVAIAALSLLVNAAALVTHSDGILRILFYWIPSRAWEMIAGGLVALAPGKFTDRQRLWIGSLGLVLIAASVAVFDSAFVWPSAYALLPVVGTALVIWAQDANPVWAKVPGLQTLGRWSYSIYLWHWPTLVIIALLGWAETGLGILFGILVSIVLGALSYTLVETRLTNLLFRRGQGAGMRSLGLVIAPVLLVAGLSFASHGFERPRLHFQTQKTVDDVARTKAAKADWKFPKTCGDFHTTSTGLQLCRMGGGGPVKTFVIGDSHGQQIADGFADLPHGATVPAILFATRAGCAPLPGVDLEASITRCSRSTDEALKLAETGRFERVAIVSSWSGAFGKSHGARRRGRICTVENRFVCTASNDETVYLRQSEQAFDRLAARLAPVKSAGAQLVIFKGFPGGGGFGPGELYDRAFAEGLPTNVTFEREKAEEINDFGDALVDRFAHATGAHVVEPMKHMCDASTCPAMLDGEPLYYDPTHLRSRTLRLPMMSFLIEELAPWASAAPEAQKR